MLSLSLCSQKADFPSPNATSALDLEKVQVRTPTLHVKPEIIRGISLRKCLRHVKHLWWQSPIDLDPSRRQSLWKKSGPVSGFDVFLSHTWLTSGLLKCLSLLLQTAWTWCLALWLLCMILMVVLYLMELLPMPGTYEAELDDNMMLPLGRACETCLRLFGVDVGAP